MTETGPEDSGRFRRILTRDLMLPLAMRDDQEQCRQGGCNDYLAKPVELDRLVSLLRVWLPSTA